MKCLGANIKVKQDLSNYATKADLKNAKVVDASGFVKKTNLAKFVDKLDIDKLKNVQSNISNLKSKVDKLDIWKIRNYSS